MEIINKIFLEKVSSCKWFSRLGSGGNSPNTIFLNSLNAWGENLTVVSQKDLRISDELIWLPSTIDGDDPFYPFSLKNHENYPQIKTEVMRFYKETLKSLRNALNPPSLYVAPHHFDKAAKGAAAFAMKAMYSEALLGLGSNWEKIGNFYFEGHWPCGFLNDRTLVVF